MPKMTATERAIAQMLTENTGRAMMDSGGAYGRHWERNQARDFAAEPATRFTVRVYDGKPEIEVSHNVFHWLVERLEYEPRMTAAFRRFANKAEHEDSGWLEIMETWAERRLNGRNSFTGADKPQMINTYNGEDLLSQTLQYALWTEDGAEYVLLQIHGGCDVRGGYTAPRVFRVLEEYAMFDNARATLWEEVPKGEEAQLVLPEIGDRLFPAVWSTDDTCHWYRDTGACKQLETYDVSTDLADRGHGKLVIDEENNVAYGPVYGEPLRAGF